jgi:hypothetical protein
MPGSGSPFPVRQLSLVGVVGVSALLSSYLRKILRPNARSRKEFFLGYSKEKVRK